MYRRDAKGWLKHLDFMILDLVTLQFSFLMAYWVRHGFENPYQRDIYAQMALFLMLCDLVVIFFTEPFRNILKRGYYRELEALFQQALIVELFAVLFLFVQKEAEEYSRMSMFALPLFYVTVSYAVRLMWKKFLMRTAREGKRSLMIITTREYASQVLSDIRKNNFGTYRFAGVVLLDSDDLEQRIDGVPVVATEQTVCDYVQKQWVDEVFLSLPAAMVFPQWLMDDLVKMGITVHWDLTRVATAPGKPIVEKIGSATVLTTSMNFFTTRQAFVKRMLDILGGLVGCLLTALLFVFVAPAICFSSPGPIFFAQERIGKNGKHFKMYKFRSMYPDAEARKQELMKENKLNSDLMFKMDFDPRIIGNRILPDGTQKTGIGQFIRSTSIDEFPQFFNVLKGDMSLVGTRPPLISEFDAYEKHHRARMSVKPGITGLWQVSGRSEITDFEEVVRLDTEYIGNWSMGLDIRILWQTVVTVLKRKGSM